MLLVGGSELEMVVFVTLEKVLFCFTRSLRRLQVGLVRFGVW